MPFRLFWLAPGALAALSAAPAGRIRYVPAEYRTIQEAIDADLGAYGGTGSAALLP